MPLAAAQELYVKDLPADIAEKTVAADTITHIVVYPQAGADVERLAAQLEATLPNVTTLTAGEFDETIGSTANLLSGIIVGVGFISLIVGGLSVVNTMAMSVNERTREIGIKRAIGGTRRRIVLELVAEAGLIGLIGGADRARARCRGREPRQRRGPRVRNCPLQPHGSDRAVIARLRDRPRDGRRDRPREPRGATRSRPGPSARIGAYEMALLEAQNLRKTFHLGRHNDVPALRGVDVTIEAGEMVAIMGPSGSGKSTLMHVLGLLHRPDLDNGPAPRLADRRSRRHAAVGRRANRHPRPRARVRVPVVQPRPDTHGGRERRPRRRLRREWRRQGRAAALEALDLVGLSDRARHRPNELSGGEQQRVAIARALVNQPSLVLGDEPTGNLDSAKTADVLALLRRFNRERGQTFVIVTHDPEVGAACDRIIRMRDGLVDRLRAVAGRLTAGAARKDDRDAEPPVQAVCDVGRSPRSSPTDRPRS